LPRPVVAPPAPRHKELGFRASFLTFGLYFGGPISTMSLPSVLHVEYHNPGIDGIGIFVVLTFRASALNFQLQAPLLREPEETLIGVSIRLAGFFSKPYLDVTIERLFHAVEIR
jgi:hypothetical protein